MIRRVAVRSYAAGRKLVVAILGTTVVSIGVAMVLLPGPAVVFIPLGLGILGIEFAWARRWLRGIRERCSDAFARLSGARAA